RVGDVQSVLSSPHEGLIEQLLSELDHLRSRVRELEADLRLERAKLNAMEHTVVDELTSPPSWSHDSTPDEPCSRINYLQHLRYLKARAARVAELENPEVTREAPCPICRRKTWRYAINDALG